jgi:hypothetical protein
MWQGLKKIPKNKQGLSKKIMGACDRSNSQNFKLVGGSGRLTVE